MTWSEPHDLRPRILVGHVLEQLRAIPKATFHAILTSPPYFGLRTYGTAGQIWGGDPAHPHDWSLTPPRRGKWGKFAGGTIRGADGSKATDAAVACDAGTGEICSCGAWRGELGAEPEPELYVAHVGEIADELYRVLRPDGAFWLNIGDTWNAASPVRVNAGKKWQRADEPGYTPFSAQLTRPARTRPGGAKLKDLFGVPWLLAFELRRRGWYVRSEVIWAKPNPMPESVRDRPTNSHEHLFLLTKRRRYWYDAEEVAEPIAASTAARARFHYPNPVDNPNTSSKWGADSSRAFPAIARQLAPSTARSVLEGYDGKASKDYGSAGAQDPSAVKRRIVEGKRARAERGEPLVANLQSVWTIPTQPYRGAHFATYPERLVWTALATVAPRFGVCVRCGAPWARRLHRGEERRRLGTYSAPLPGCKHAEGTEAALVLDPFAGSGTTLKIARLRHLRSVGIELSERSANLARDRAGHADLEAVGGTA